MGNKISSLFGKKEFPLLKLPFYAINNVILTMDPVDLIAFSLCTNFTKRRVASLHLKKLRLTLTIDRYILVEMRWPDDTIVRVFLLDTNFEKWVEGDNKITEFSGPNGVVNFGPADNVNGGLLRVECREWKKEDYEMGDWLEHFKELLDVDFKHICFLPNSVRYDTSLLEATIGDFSLSIVEISPQCANAHVRDLHKNLQSLEKMVLTVNPYEALVDFQRFLIRNLKTFVFDWMFNPTLEDILVNNAKSLYVKGALSDRVINRFLKLWMKGGNRRMKYLFIYFSVGEHPTMTKILKGISPKSHGRQQDFIKINRKSGSSAGLCRRIVKGLETLMFMVFED